MVHLPAEWWGCEGRTPPPNGPLLKSTNHSIVVAQSALLSCQYKRRGHRDEWHTGWRHHLAYHVGTLHQDSIIALSLLYLDKTYTLGNRREDIVEENETVESCSTRKEKITEINNMFERLSNSHLHSLSKPNINHDHSTCPSFHFSQLIVAGCTTGFPQCRDQGPVLCW